MAPPPAILAVHDCAQWIEVPRCAAAAVATTSQAVGASREAREPAEAARQAASVQVQVMMPAPPVTGFGTHFPEVRAWLTVGYVRVGEPVHVVAAIPLKS